MKSPSLTECDLLLNKILKARKEDNIFSLLKSNECCGKCIQTHCVDGENVHPIGDTWENPKDKCYQYTCQVRDDALTTVAIKRDCPYFDPECPPEEILQDPLGCCRICNITRETKRKE